MDKVVTNSTTTTLETIAIVNETFANNSTIPDGSRSMVEVDPILLMVVCLAGICCVGGFLATFYLIKKHVRNNSSSSSHSKTRGTLTKGFQKARSMMAPCRGGNTKRTLATLVPLPVPRDHHRPQLVVGPGWMYSLLDESSQADRSPVYRPVTTPLMSVQQQQRQQKIGV